VNHRLPTGLIMDHEDSQSGYSKGKKLRARSPTLSSVTRGSSTNRISIPADMPEEDKWRVLVSLELALRIIEPPPGELRRDDGLAILFPHIVGEA